MSSLKENKTCALLEQYLMYLTVVKGRSPLTADEYRIDCEMFFEYVKGVRGDTEESLAKRDFSDIDINYIKSITVGRLNLIEKSDKLKICRFFNKFSICTDLSHTAETSGKSWRRRGRGKSCLYGSSGST